MRPFVLFLAAGATATESSIAAIVGAAIALYGLRARKFRESSRLHMLTPIDQLEEYEPRWYHRLLYVVAGVVLMTFGIAGLWRAFHG